MKTVQNDNRGDVKDIDYLAWRVMRYRDRQRDQRVARVIASRSHLWGPTTRH